MARLTRDAILKADDLPTEEIDVPEWGGSVVVRALTLAQRSNVTELATHNGVLDSTRLEAFLFIEGVIEPRFSMADYDALRGKNVGLIERVALRVAKLSGVSKSALEDAIKNSAPTQSADSSTN